MPGLQGVLRLHSGVAALCGATAVARPALCGAAFPSLTSAHTLAFAAQLWSILVLAQVPLLGAFRRVQDRALLRRVSAAYGLAFLATAAVACHAELVVKVANAEVLLSPMWLAMGLAYGALAANGSEGTFGMFSYFHTVLAAVVGATGVVAPRELNYEMLRAPRPGPAGAESFNSMCRHYGVLVCSMGLLAYLLSTPAAAPAWPWARRTLAVAWAASAAAIGGAMHAGTARGADGLQESLPGLACAGSLVLCAAMALLYATAHTPADAAAKRQ